MRINCATCESEISLDHKVFNDYDGPVKCFCCGTMMDIRTKGGILDSIRSASILPEPLTDVAVEHTF